MAGISIKEIEDLAAHYDNDECKDYESGCDCAWCEGRKATSTQDEGSEE